MAIPKLGIGAKVGFKSETTYGTAVTPDRFFKLVEADVGEDHSYKDRPDLYQEGGWMAGGHYLEKIDTSFKLKLEVLVEGMGVLWQHFMWATASTTGSGDPYTHVYALTMTVPAGLTIEVDRGTGTAEILSGAMVSKATLSARTGEPMYLELEGIAVKADSRASATSPTFTSNYLPIRHHHMGSISWNSRTLQTRSWTFTLDRKLARRPLLGSNYTAQPLPDALLEASWEVEVEYVDDTLWDDLRSGTQADASVTWTNTTNRSVAFALHNARAVGNLNPAATKPGVQTQRLKLMGSDDGTDRGALITVVNSQSSGAAA